MGNDNTSNAVSDAVTDNPKLAAIPPQYERSIEAGKELQAFLTEKELLTRLPISRRTCFAWVQSGKLPCVKIGRRKLYHWPSVQSALLRLQSGIVE
jgi:hypothetical protein